MNDYSYRAPNGLPCRYTLESDTHIENNGLFGEYEVVFTGNGEEAVAEYINEAKEMGYPNHNESSVPQKKLSHDQVTFFFSARKRMGLEIESIPYPPDWHPRDFLYYGLLRDQFYAILLIPIFYIICAMSLFIGYRWKDGKFQPKLSGELLWILRYETMKNDDKLAPFAVPLKYIIKYGAKMRFGSVKNMVFAYFYDDIEHPILRKWNYELV